MRTNLPCIPTGSSLPDDLALLDRWMAEERHPALRDGLLDLRAACAASDLAPLRVVHTFLRLRPLLKRSSYWFQHRVRRALERRLRVEVTTPEESWQEPLRLNWNTLARTLDAIRREVFERGVTDWDHIRVRLVSPTH